MGKQWQIRYATEYAFTINNNKETFRHRRDRDQQIVYAEFVFRCFCFGKQLEANKTLSGTLE